MIRNIVKNYGKAFIFLNILVMLLVLVNCIPTSLIYDNLCESVVKYNETLDSVNESSILRQSDASADCNELNILMNIDSKKPFYSALLAPFYREFDNQNFPEMARKTILDRKGTKYNYNRYWHGYQVIWRPLLIVLNAHQIMFLMMILYLGLLGLLLYKLYKKNLKLFGVGIILMNIWYIVPCGFTALEYIPLFFIYVIGCLLVLKDKVNKVVLFCCLGVAISFSDFWTSETLTLTVPLLLYIYMMQKKKDLRMLSCVKVGLNWLIGYCGTFLYKWLLSTLFLGVDYFKIAYEKFSTHENRFGILNSVKINLNTLFFNVSSINMTFNISVILFIIFMLILYLFRKDNNTKFLISLLIVGLIPYLRYIVLPGHSFAFSFFTYRAQLILIPIIVLLFSELDYKLLK